MKLRLESFGELRLMSPAGQPVAFPEKDLLALCYLLDRYLQDGAASEYPRSALARLLWDSHDNPDIMANVRKTISRIQARQAELGIELLVFSATGVRIRPDAFACDLSIFANPDSGDALENLRRLVDVLRQRSARSLPAVSRRKALRRRSARAAAGFPAPCPASCCCRRARRMGSAPCRCCLRR